MTTKYVIELGDDVQFVAKVGVTASGNAYSLGEYKVDLEELNSDYINEHYGELQDEAYQRGLEDGKWKAEDGCDGCKYYEDTSLTNPCSECSRGHVDHYKPVSDLDRIEVGDIVERYIDGKLDSKGIYLEEDDGYWRCLFDTDAMLMTFSCPKEQFKKTGKHYDIQSILEAMRT